MSAVRGRSGGLAIAVVVTCLGLTAPPAADAATYCAPSEPGSGGCDGGHFATIQEALDAAGGHAGPDSVVIQGFQNTLTTGVVYSDHGQPDNGVAVTSVACGYGGCSKGRLAGGQPGETLLSFTGGGGAAVDVSFVAFNPGPGVTGLMLPPGGHASVEVWGEDGSIGVRAEGTAERPAAIEGYFQQQVGGATDIAVDAAGAAVVTEPAILSDIGARSRGSDGLLDIRGGSITARVGVTGRSARVTRTFMDLRGQPEPVLGFEAACAGADGPDAEITARNVTVRASDGAASTGARALGRGGDGSSCDALVRLNSSILNGFATSLDAAGGEGSGADPQDGLARFEMAYSNFDPQAVRQSGPSTIVTDNPGGNVYGDPVFNPRRYHTEPTLMWDSPLIDHGDPAPLDGWELDTQSQLWPLLVNGRRDIGAREYQFGTPGVEPFKLPDQPRIPRLGVARLGVGASDRDLDPLQVHWTLSNGQHADYAHDWDHDFDPSRSPTVARRYRRSGTFVEHVTVSDPTGRSTTSQITVRVVKQWMRYLAVVPRRTRPQALESVPGNTVIRFAPRVPGRVNFRIERGVPRGKSGRLRWIRTRFRFHAQSAPVGFDSTLSPPDGITTLRFNGWLQGRRIRPGRYRLVATPPGARPMRFRFRMLKVHL